MIRRKFKSCSEVKLKLFQSYCSSFYCCSLLSNSDQKLIDRCNVCYNNGFRYFITTKFKDSISGHFVNSNLPNFDILLRKSVLSLYHRIISSQNILISTNVSSPFLVYSEFMFYWKTVFN